MQINPMENSREEIVKLQISEIDVDTNVFFELASQNCNDNTSINYVYLSSSERIILQLYKWEYLMKHCMSSKNPTQILRFDEPDSHWHPCKIKEMIPFLQNLVKNMKKIAD